MSIIAQS